MFVLPLSRSALAPRARVVPAFGTALDRLFDESFDRYFGGAKAGAETRTPTMDVSEDDTSYTVVLDVPGATREQLKVSIEGRRITLSTVATSEASSQPSGSRAGRRARGEARSAFALPRALCRPLRDAPSCCRRKWTRPLRKRSSRTAS